MNSNQNENKLNNEIEKQLKTLRDSAILSGCKAICGVVLEKAKNSKKTESERIVDIIEFCERSLGVSNKGV